MATALGIWLLGERLTHNVVIGGTLILLGVYLTERERGEEVEEPDLLVVGGRQPAKESRSLRPHALEALDVRLGPRSEFDRHGYRSSSR